MKLAAVFKPLRPVEEMETDLKREVDLFDALNLMFRKERLAYGTWPSTFILHRFLASDMDYALVARQIQRTVREPEHVYEIWRAAVNRAPGAPYLKYCGPKARPAADDLVQRIMAVECLNRFRAEEVVALLEERNRLDEALRYYGVEPTRQKPEKAGKRRKNQANAG